MFSPKLFVFPTFEENLFHIIRLFSDEVAGLRGGGPLKRPPEAMIDYFQGKYCNPDDVLKLAPEGEVSIRINGRLLNFERFSENAGLGEPQAEPASPTVAELIVPFSGNGELLSVKPSRLRTIIDFKVVSVRPPNAIVVEKTYEAYDEERIDSDCLTAIERIAELAEHLNRDFLELGKRFSAGVMRLTSHATKLFKTRKAVLGFCFSHLAYHGRLIEIFG